MGPKGRHKDALDSFSRALDADTMLAISWVVRGFTLGKLGRYEEWIESCDKATIMDSMCEDAWNNKAFAYSMHDRIWEKLH